MNSYYAFSPRHINSLKGNITEGSESAFAATYYDLSQCGSDDGAFVRLYQSRMNRIARTLALIYQDADLQPGGDFDPSFDEWDNGTDWVLANHVDLTSSQWKALWN